MPHLNQEKEFETKIREHESLLYKVCRIYAHTAVDRQDLFQEIVLQAWKSFPKFKGTAAFSTWLYRIAINVSITGLRNKTAFIDSRAPAHLPDSNVEEMHNDNDEQLNLLYKSIEQLTEIEKAIVMLYMEDYSYEEMEDILGINSGTLRVRMNRVKEKLRQLTKNN